MKKAIGPLILVIVSLLMVVSCATTKDANALHDLAHMMVGDFVSTSSSNESEFVDRRRRLNALGEGEWIYWQVNTGVERRLYRQRVLQLVPDSNGRVRQITYSLTADHDRRDLIADPDRLASIKMRDLKGSLNDGCQPIWVHSRRHGNDFWLGVVSPERCVIYSNRRGQKIRIGAESRLSATELWQAERGFDLAGKWLWGSAPGEFNQLTRLQEKGSGQ